MIIAETIIINNREFTKTYSTDGKYVVRDGISYEEAIDPSEYNRTYEEGDSIYTIAENYNIYADVGKILMGVSE